MSEDVHVRFCERLGGRFLGATRPVLCFADETDAKRVMDVLPKRFARYGLRLHPVKTKLVSFKSPRHTDDPRGNRSFDLLGFTHYWGKSRRGRWIIQRKTATDRFQRSLRAFALWCKRHRHVAVPIQHRALWRKLRGYYAYYGIRGNAKQLRCMRYRVERAWIKWLSRRSQRAKLDWVQASRLLARYPLPPARLVASGVT